MDSLSMESLAHYSAVAVQNIQKFLEAVLRKEGLDLVPQVLKVCLYIRQGHDIISFQVSPQDGVECGLHVLHNIECVVNVS